MHVFLEREVCQRGRYPHETTGRSKVIIRKMTDIQWTYQIFTQSCCWWWWWWWIFQLTIPFLSSHYHLPSALVLLKESVKLIKCLVFFLSPTSLHSISLSCPLTSYPTNNIFLKVSFSKASCVRPDLRHLPSLSDLLAAIGILCVGHDAPGKLESIGNFIVLSSLAASIFLLNAPLKVWTHKPRWEMPPKITDRTFPFVPLDRQWGLSSEHSLAHK